MGKLITIIAFLLCCFPAKARVIYVRASATGLNNGTSWANAFNKLDTALTTTKSDTVWVANGTYRAGHIMRDSVKLFGGFTGTETSLAQRNPAGHQTILDGDIGTPVYKPDNARVLLLAISANATGVDLVVDGFRIINGYTTLSGAGISIDQASIANVRILIANCYFVNNEAGTGGGAIGVMSRGTTTISNCRFESNSATGTFGSGGAVSKGIGLRNTLLAGPVYISDCIFRNNTAKHGGALYARDSTITSVNRCVFMGNTATEGGAIYDTWLANLQVYSTLIAGNRAATGAAHFSDTTNTAGLHSFLHCTIAHNLCNGSVSPAYDMWLRGPKDVLRNSILWGNIAGSTTAPVIGSPATGAVYMDNVIQGGAGLTGTTATHTFNPLFVAPGAALSAPFPVTAAYDYHLASLSLAVDTGANLALAAPYNLDLDNNPRVQGRMPELGAYEWKSCPWLNASISASGPTTFCLPGSVTLTASANPAYTYTYIWNGGAHTGRSLSVSTSGVQMVVVVDSLGCRSSAGMMVNAVPSPKPAITYGAGNTLSIPATYASYQWYLNGAPIPGATAATYHPSVNGNYTVQVTTTIGGCTGTSPVYQLRNVAAGLELLSAEWRIYPNPGHGRFMFAADRPWLALTITIRNVTGQPVWRKQCGPGSRVLKEEIDISGHPKGIYYAEIITDHERLLCKLVLQ